MKALVIGYGKMGKLIEELAPEYGVTVEAIIDRGFPAEEVKKQSTPRRYLELTEEAVTSCQVVIDFSSSDGILQRSELIAKHKVPYVIGTTGWDNDLQAVKRTVSKHKSSCLASNNFSLGAQLFFKLVKEAAGLFAPFESYDVSVLEMHHTQKKDHPSGTAKEVAALLMSKMERKKKVLYDLPDAAIKPDTLQVASVRCGSHPGEHQVIFDSSDDSITITHTARSRRDFARGAIIAAKWLQGKKGWFDMHDLIKEGKAVC